MNTSLRDVVQLHHDAAIAAGLAPATLHWYSLQFAAFDAWRLANGFPDLLPDAATIEQFIAHETARGLRPRSLHARYRALGVLFNFAQRRRLIAVADNPFALMRAPRIPKERPRHVDMPVMRKLLAAADGDTWLDQRDRLIFQLLFFCGLRVGELVALRVADVDFAREEVFVRQGKGAKPRMVPMAPAVRAAVVPYVYSRPSTSEWLLVTTSKRLTSEGVRSMLRRRCAQAGIEDWNAHAFRHGFAMWMRNNGADLSDVAAAMGHSNAQVTGQYYAFTLPPAVKKAYQRALSRMTETEGAI